ncbi:hypothetical protein NBRC116493_32650 [Aurantivibrio infirmus]
MYQELERNIPGHPKWKGSFYERLVEYREWDVDSFWSLHLELLQIAKNNKESDMVDRNLAYKLLTIQQKVLNLVTSHFVKNDIFKIRNLSTDQIYDFKERFEMAIISAVTGSVVPESSFKLTNPLVKNA